MFWNLRVYNRFYKLHVLYIWYRYTSYTNTMLFDYIPLLYLFCVNRSLYWLELLSITVVVGSHVKIKAKQEIPQGSCDENTCDKHKTNLG